jgi:hypothetical protein
MKTKSVNVKCNNKNFEIIDAMPFYADSPWYVYKMLEWASDPKNKDLELGPYRLCNENQVELLCEDLIQLGIEFTRTLVVEKKYNNE